MAMRKILFFRRRRRNAFHTIPFKIIIGTARCQYYYTRCSQKLQDINIFLIKPRQHLLRYYSLKDKDFPQTHIITMNIRQIKLALSIRLLNMPAGNIMKGILELLYDFEDQLGAFVSIDLEKVSSLSERQVYQQFNLFYERAALQIGVVINPISKTQTLQSFHITEPVRFAA